MAQNWLTDLWLKLVNYVRLESGQMQVTKLSTALLCTPVMSNICHLWHARKVLPDFTLVACRGLQ